MGLIGTNLETIDFAKLYKEQIENSTFKGKSQEDWSKKAKSYNENIQKSSYAKEFVNKLNLEDAQTLLDVGCGPGTISLELASRFKQAYAMDYSLGMLDCLKENCIARDINNVIPIHKSWDDDWNDIPKCDIIVASRSMEVIDIATALQKLNAKANKRVYIAFKVGGSFIDNEILTRLDREVIPRPDYIYLLNILHSMKIYASVDFIFAHNNRFLSKNDEEFLEKVSWSLGTLCDDESIILKNYFNDTYKFKKEAPHIQWAIISWEVKK